MGDREERRRAAREAVVQARLEAERPWWQRRLFAWFISLPSRFWRSLKWWGRELGEGAFEVLLGLVALVFVLAVWMLGSWAWQTAPVPTGVLIAAAVAFLTFGGVEFFRDRRRGRLAMTAVIAFCFVALWVVPYVLF
ncbi:hypothetical protein [Lentzea roselyniae]|uniref:hypothetical protein n=1 Tax=Lentzea roselyniae TaxID=531940 RepID=UPI0031F92200